MPASLLSGCARNYTRNGLNQYLSAGSATFSYDARGTRPQ